MGTQKGKVRSPHLSLRLRKPLYDKLLRRVQIQGKSKTEIVEEALEVYYQTVPEDQDLNMFLTEMSDRIAHLQSGQTNLLSRVEHLEENR